MPVTSSGRTVVFTTTSATTIEGVVAPVASEMAKRGISVHFVTGDRPADVSFSHEATTIETARSIDPNSDIKALREWVAFLRSHRPDMVVAGTPKASLISLLAARRVGIRHRVYVMHGAVWEAERGVKGRILRTAERTTVGAATNVLSVSDSLARLVSNRGLTSDMPSVIGAGSYAGVDVERFRPKSRSAPREAFRLCFVGRLTQDKGIDTLVRLVDGLKDRCQVRLTIVGASDARVPLDNATAQAVRNHPLIEWVGFRNDVERYLNEADLFLMPTLREGLPQSALEAQACGVPVVGWRSTGLIDAVCDGFGGYLVVPGDEAALAGATLALLNNDELRATMGIFAREWILNKFDRRLVVRRNSDFLESLLNT